MSDPDVASSDPSGEPAGVRDLYRTFFDHAEKKRRWSVVEAIPWDQIKPGTVDPELVDILEAFYSVEMFLPDYTSQLIQLNRENHGMAWFLTNWCYEESKHSMAIEEWMIRSGGRTQQQMERLNQRLLSTQWSLPFETSRRMVIYAMLQESATQLHYLNLSKLTASSGDPALQKMLLLIASDEGRHHKMFTDCVKEHLRVDRASTVADIAYVVHHFRMPAHDLIPDFERKGQLIERHEIFGGREFLARVVAPAMESVDVTRKEFQLARRAR